jgi:alkylation response protein AidB-like acyl-CoA dehydrogenase
MRRTLFDHEHDDFRAAVRTFVEREVAPHHERWRDAHEIDRELWLAAYGYMDEYPVARAWADARVTKIWAGTNEIMKELIGRSLGFGEEHA